MFLTSAAIVFSLVAGPTGDSSALLRDLERRVGADGWLALHQVVGGEEFFESLGSNEIWLREILDSGPVRRPEVVLGFLQEVWQADRDLVQRPVDRGMATACALALGFRDGDSAGMVARYEYYRDSDSAGLLNVCYKGLATWERRFLARGAQWGSMGGAESLVYLRDRICWPRPDYVKACWQAPYRSYNCLADSVQRPDYYMPFNGSYAAMPEMVIDVGGVCGALSNLGASAAIANGIPASTMGEPGHCAYTVKISDDEWKPAYSLSWKRSMHTSFFEATWPNLMLTEACFSDPERVAKSGDLARRAFALEMDGDLEQAADCWRQALNAHGLHYGLWVEWAAFGERTDRDANWWRDYQTALLVGLKGHEEPAWTLLSKRVYPRLLAGMDDAEKLRVLLRWIRNLQNWGGGRWNVEGAWNWIFKQLGEDGQRKLVRVMSERLIESPDFGPPLVVWLLAKYSPDSEEGRDTLGLILKASGSGGDGAQSALKQLARTAMLDAAARGDVDTFQAIGKQASSLSEPLSMKGIEPFPGDLVSAGGLLQVSGRGNRWDSPENHWGILGEHGGRCHTNNGASFIAVRLEHHTEITGIVIQNLKGGQSWRATDSRIEISADGESWEQIGSLEGNKRFYRLDLEGKHQRALWVRMAKDTNCLHVRRFLVWGHRRS